MPRHALPYIGSPAWDKELARGLGVRRSWVDAVLARVGREGEPSDPFAIWSTIRDASLDSLRWDESPLGLPAETPDQAAEEELERSLHLAAGVLVHQENPGYGLLANIDHADYEGRRGRWFSEQLATMVARGPAAVSDSAKYLLSMNVFWNPAQSRLVFPRLAAALPKGNREELLALSAGVPWEDKRAFYEKLALSPAHHPALARALLDSCQSGNLQSSDALAFRSLLSRLTVPDASLVAAIQEAIGEPVRATVLALLLPGRSTPRPLQHPGRYLVRLDFHTSVATWLIGSELWYRKRQRGIFGAFRCFIEPDERARSTSYKVLVSQLQGYTRHWIEPSGPTSDADLVRWHAIDGDPEEALDLLGQKVEFWAPGMRSLR